MMYQTLMNDPTKKTIRDHYLYAIYQTDDQKIYNVDHKTKSITLVRDPLRCRFNVSDVVLVKDVGEYGIVDEVKLDSTWGNHSVAVEIFNLPDHSKYYDEYELDKAS